jgi:hypothetical protein
VPIAFLLQQNNLPKQVHKHEADERSILSPREIESMKRKDNEGAREAARTRKDWLRSRASEAALPDMLVMMQVRTPLLFGIRNTQRNAVVLGGPCAGVLQ